MVSIGCSLVYKPLHNSLVYSFAHAAQGELSSDWNVNHSDTANCMAWWLGLQNSDNYQIPPTLALAQYSDTRNDNKYK